jgi:DNA modification methylase
MADEVGEMTDYAGGRVLVWHEECLTALRFLPDASVDAVVTDPPYGLGKEPDMAEVMRHWLAGDDYTHTGGGFMGKTWDSFVPGPSVWRECFRVLKPGGHLLSFAGSRTQDLMGLAIRLAGFEIRDGIAWLYGSGFPKSLDVSKAIDKAAGVEFDARPASGVGFMTPTGEGGYNVTKNQLTRRGESTEAAQQWQGWGTALKPAFEPVIVARKPLSGTVAANVQEWGTGALNIDACKIPASDKAKFPEGYSKATGAAYAQDEYSKTWTSGADRSLDSRWPTNVVLDESQAADLDQQTGILTRGANPKRRGADKDRTAYGEFSSQEDANPVRGMDSGGASRFFPVFKYQAKASAKERPKDADGKGHPTVKPLELMRWLVKLVTPPDGLVLDPFGGSGTTAEACLLEGFRCILMENHSEYYPLMEQRMERSCPEPDTDQSA